MFTGREFSKKSERICYAYFTKHNIAHTPENRTLFNAAFYLGAQYATQTTSELSPHIARFMEFIMWLWEMDSADRKEPDSN
jgi:hypothetical protein